MELAALRESAAADLGLVVGDWIDGEDPYQCVADVLGGGPVATAVTDSMPALHLLPLADVLGVVPVLATGVLAGLRMVKDPAEIAALRIAGASYLPPHRVVVDGNRVPMLPMPVAAVIKGDAQVAAISAASILAKVTRDRLCAELHTRFPLYGFEGHKGYPTPAHLAALRTHGPCPEHRRSYAPVRACLRGEGGS
jgi:hypothetical protein